MYNVISKNSHTHPLWNTGKFKVLKIQEFLKNLSKFMKKSVLYNVEITIITKATLKFWGSAY